MTRTLPVATIRSVAFTLATIAVLLVASSLVLAAGPGAAPPGGAPKHGGVLLSSQADDPGGFSIHETATIYGMWPVTPCYSNLVLFDPFKPLETVDTIVPELAERWSWQDGYRNLVFFLRKDVRWHDGQPFTARDVKYTFDIVREARDAPAKLRLNPRKEWYSNVEAIEVADAYTVIFRLKRPQPSLLMMLAAGYSPVYPAHVPVGTLRAKCVGTGPFRLKSYVPGQVVELERNPDYFVKGRPYLDGIRYTIIPERSTRMAALQAGRLDAQQPGDVTKVMAETLTHTVPSIVVPGIASNGTDNVLLNHKRPPFDKIAVRRAVSFALDRYGAVEAVRHGGSQVGVSMAPRPYGFWGLSAKELAGFPGYHDPVRGKAEARRLLASVGFGPNNPLKVDLATRNFATQNDLTSFVVSELRQAGIEVTLRTLETPQWFPTLVRRDYTMATNTTAIGIDDPDAVFYENYKCGSSRNYTEHCDPAVDRMIDAQSQEVDRGKRLKLVTEIQRRLEDNVARPMLGFRMEYLAQWAYVKNLVPHNSVYNFGRMQEVWLDR
jgi:peptide/nickel transport system substrate-binding protein